MRLLDTLMRFLGLDNDAPLLSLPLSMVSQRLPQRRFVVACCFVRLAISGIAAFFGFGWIAAFFGLLSQGSRADIWDGFFRCERGTSAPWSLLPPGPRHLAGWRRGTEYLCSPCVGLASGECQYETKLQKWEWNLQL